MIRILKFSLIITLFTVISNNTTMAYEEPKYKIIKSSEIYEIRRYNDRLAVEIEYSNEDSGFRYLFNYISGENIKSEKVKMTVPVTQSTQNKRMKMQFYLPSNFTKQNAPEPINERVKLVIIKGGDYAVIKYSGRLNNKNYSKYYEKLKDQLIEDKINYTEPPIRATFNGPFTLPILRRNEIMMKIDYDEYN